jgi:hypothetical protein
MNQRIPSASTAEFFNKIRQEQTFVDRMFSEPQARP